jgi:hypothetical protein
MRKTMLGSLTGLLIPFAAYAAPIGYGAYQRRQPAYMASHLPLEPVGQYKLRPESTADVDEAELKVFSGSPVKELVIIDFAVPDKAVLQSAARPGIETVILRAGEDTLEQMATLLKSYRNLEAVHLVSHGESGAILLGNQRIDKDTLEARPEFLAALSAATRAGADLLLYACDVASEDTELLELIQQNTHLDIAASSNLTGAAELGGDWTLEIQTGNIETAQAFSDKALQDFSAVLRPFGPKTFEAFNSEVYQTNPSQAFGDFTTFIQSTQLEMLSGTVDVCENDLYVSMYGYADAEPNTSKFYIRSEPSGDNFGVTQLILLRSGSNPATQVNIQGFATVASTTPIATKNGVSIGVSNTAVDLTTGVTGSFAQVAKVRIAPVDNSNFCINTIGFSPLDSDGNLTAAAGVTEPVGLATTVDTVGEAVNVFDFTISDGGASDAQALTVAQIVLNVSGTSTDTERSRITWRLNGPDAGNVTGTYSAAADTITFSGLGISVANAGNETYTVNAFYNNNTGLTDGRTVILSVDGDTNLTVGASGTQMASTTAVTNGTGTTIDVVATQLVFATQPSGSVSGSALTGQPVVAARDAAGNNDTGFTETITLTEASAGTLSNNTQAATAGVATFTNLIYSATADQQSFTLTANDQDGVGSNLPTVDSNSVTSNVLATKLLFTTQPVPTSINSGAATSFTTVPVVSATDANNIVDTGHATSILLSVTDPNDGTVDGTVNSLTGTGDTDGSGTTVTLTPSSGVAAYTGLQLTYTASGGSNTIALRAASSGLTAANSSNITAASTPVVTAGNISISGATGTGGAYMIGDTVTATWNNTGAGDNNAGITGVTVNFSQFGGGTAVTASNSSNTWTATYTIVAGSVSTTNRNVSVTATNASGDTTTTDNANATVDNIRPTATLVVADTALAIGETSLVTITFSEAVTGFANADLTIANGSLSAVSSGDGGITWTATFTPTASITDASNVITLANTGVQDAVGNAGSGTTDSNNYAIDTVRPTAGIVVSDTALIAGETSLVTITFSEAVTGFANADLTIANGTLSAVSSGDGGVTWTATFTPSASISDASNVITLANTGVQDAAGNTGSGTTDSNNYAINTVRPTASIVVADTALAVGETSLVTITFSEAVTGFTNADLTIANGSLSAVSSGDGGVTWTTTLTPTASINDASNLITLANTGVQNAAGNTGSGTTDSNNYAIDTARPTASIVVADTALAVGETSLVTITFSEAVTGFTNADLTIANGSLSSVSSGDGGVTWTATLTPTASINDASNLITLANTGVQDAAGNTGSGTTDSNNYAIDTTRPTAGIVVADTALIAGETSLVTITFSEAVTGFANADLTIANGTLSAVSSGDGGITWTATLTPTASINDATNVITLANSGVQDAAGNTGTGTTDSNNYAINTVRPTASIVVADTALASGETSLVTITFSEAVTGFANADLTIANGTLSTVSSSDGGVTWTATLTPTAGVNDPTNVITLANTGVQNAAGNTGTGTTDSNNYSLDTDVPTVSSVSVPVSATYVAGQDLDFTVNYDEVVTVNTTGGTPQLALTVGGDTRTANYLSGSPGSALVFRYTVQAGDNDTDGIALTALNANGGTLQDSSGNNASTSLVSIGSLAAVRVDTAAPVVGTNTGLSVSEDDSGTISDTRLAATDNLSAAANVVYTVVSIPANGTLFLSGGALSNGNTFTQDDIDDDRVTYDHDGSATASDSFTFNVRDAVNNVNNNASANFSFAFTISPPDEPAITAPANVDIDATGLYTTVTIRQLLGLAANASNSDVQAARLALATDVADGANCCNPVALELEDGRIRFAPGTHTITWRATDSNSNTAEDTQTVNVHPLISFAKDQVGVEGGQVELRFFLNGPAPVYPLFVNYDIDTAESSAGGSDHDLVDSDVQFDAGETEVSITVNLNDEDGAEGDEVLVVRLAGILNAGATDSHRITITEGNVAPTVVLSLEQNGVDTALVTPTGGTVTVMAAFDDQNADDDGLYDWSMTNAMLIDTDGDTADAVFEFDPSALTEGALRLHVAVSDGTVTTTAALNFRVVTALPNGGTGTGDADGDGIPGYLDAIEAANVLPETAAQTDAYLVECDPGVRCRLGRHALLGSNGGARLTAGQLRMQDIEDDDDYRHRGGIFDFEAHDLPVAGQSVRVAIPLQGTIPAGAVYRKFSDGQWSDFVTDSNNAVHSAAGEAGYCPPPGDATWRSGLRSGYRCIQLTIQDGGPNDVDGETNGSIEDPGSVATHAMEEVVVHGQVKGGGSSDGFFLLALTLLAALRGRRAGKGIASALLLLLLPVQAQAVDWKALLADSYIELGFSQAEGSRSRGELVSGLTADGVTAGIQAYDVSRGAAQIQVGYQYQERLAVWLGYLDLGDVEVEVAASAPSDEILSAAFAKHYPVSADGFVLAHRYEYPLRDRLGLTVDAGFYIWESEIRLSDSNGRDIGVNDRSDTDPILGLGGNYRISDRYTAGLNWQRVFFSDQEVDLLGVSGSLNF